MTQTELHPAATIEVTDRRSAQRWLAQARLLEPRQACYELTTLLESLEDSPPKPRDYLDVLDVLHRPILVAASEHAVKFSGRPLPLAPPEQAAFDQLSDLLATSARSYRRFVNVASEDASGPLAKSLEHLAGCALEMIVEHLAVHYRARHEVDPELWQSIHDIYQLAEEEGFTLTPIQHANRRVLTCAELYARALILHLAGPYGMSNREFDLVRRWTRSWAGRVAISGIPEGKERFVVDLGGGEPPRLLRPDADSGAAIRYIRLSDLRRRVRRRIQAIEDEGRSPAELGLGEQCTSDEAIQLLRHLHRQWSAPATRQFRRRPVSTRAELASGFDAIHLAIGGKLASSQSQHWDFTERETDNVYTSLSALSGSEPETAVGTRAERWDVLDETANGFRLRRRSPGARLQCLQLIALKPQGATSYLLCEIRWLMIAIDHSVTIGVQALPGLPKPLSARPPGKSGGASTDLVPAFLLCGAQRDDQSLVVPVGWYEVDRVLQVAPDVQLRSIRLDQLVQRGSDYERIRFTTLG